MKDEDKCTTPRCRGRPEVEYLGKLLCGKCWDKQAEKPIIKAKPEAENKTHLIHNQDLTTIRKAYQQTIEQATQRATQQAIKDIKSKAT